MYRILVLALLCVCQSFAATRVLDAINNALGQPATGSIHLTWPSFTTPSGSPIAGGQRIVTISNGVLDLILEPTPAGIRYTARFFLTGSVASYTEFWAVPDSPNPVTLADIRVTGPSGGAANFMSSLDVLQGGLMVGSRRRINFASGATVTDDPVNERINVSISGGGGGGAVDSVFGRTGTVAAQAGDYTAAQVTNAVSTLGSYSNPTWITGLDGSKITSPVPSAQLPNPAVGAKGGVEALTCSGTDKLSAIGTNGIPVCTADGGGGGGGSFPETTTTTQLNLTDDQIIGDPAITVATVRITCSQSEMLVNAEPNIATASATDGRWLVVINQGLNNSCILQDYNQFANSGLNLGGDGLMHRLPPGKGALFVFVGSDSRWHLVGNTSETMFPSPAGMDYGKPRVNAAGSLYEIAFDQVDLPTAAQSISTAGTALTCDRAYCRIDPQSSLTSSATPTMPDGANGESREIFNTSAANTYTIPGEGTLAGVNFCTGAEIATRKAVSFRYDADASCWATVGSTGSAGASAAKFDAKWLPVCQNTIGGSPFSFPPTDAPVTQCAADTGLPVTNFPAYATVNWDDSGTKSVFAQILLPEFGQPMPTSLRARIGISAGNDAVSQEFGPRIYTMCYAPGQTPDQAFNAAQAFTPTTSSGTVDAWTGHIVTSLDLTGCSAGEILVLKLDRDTTDTSTEMMRLHFLRIFEP